MEIVYKKVTADRLHDLTFTIKSKSIVGIAGREKTLLLKILNGVVEITGDAKYGSDKYNDKNINKIRNKVNIVEKEFNRQIFLNTVEEHIAFLIKYYKFTFKDPRKKVLQALKIVGLEEDYLQKKLEILSSSEQKLLQIAIALLSNPSVILLDEPFSNLDAKSYKKLKRLIFKLKDKYEKSIIIASNDCDMLYEITDQMIFLKNNTILKMDDTDKLYQDVKFLSKNGYDIPDLVLFTYNANTMKKASLSYHKDIRDLIKDVYKHV